jgi:hypothetical protein
MEIGSFADEQTKGGSTRVLRSLQQEQAASCCHMRADTRHYRRLPSNRICMADVLIPRFSHFKEINFIMRIKTRYMLNMNWLQVRDGERF